MKIILTGALGRMGRAVAQSAVSKGHEIAFGVDAKDGTADFPLFKSLSAAEFSGDVIIDFSNHAFTQEILKFAIEKNIPAVIATTGHDSDQLDAINKAADIIPVFYSRNMSLGVNLLVSLCRRAAEMLGEDFDIEIIERHHSNKLDAPSGTALMLADAVAESRGSNPSYVYDRHTRREIRPKNEIGIHSVRGGSIVGEHDVIFAGHDEVLTLSHSAQSREVFAEGAVRAAGFIIDKPPKKYSMDDIIAEIG